MTLASADELLEISSPVSFQHPAPLANVNVGAPSEDVERMKRHVSLIGNDVYQRTVRCSEGKDRGKIRALDRYVIRGCSRATWEYRKCEAV